MDRPAGTIKVMYFIGELGRGGSERQLFLLLKQLVHRAFQLHVVVFNPSAHGVYNDELVSMGVQVHAVPQNCRGVAKRARWLYYLLRNISPDIVHSWTTHDNPYAGLLGWLAGIPVRWGSVRGSLTSSGFQGLPFLFRWLSLHAVSKLMVNSTAIVNELVDAGVRRDNVIFLRNCVEMEAAGSASTLAEYGIDETSKVVGTVGNLRRVKNQEMFVNAMAGILLERDDVAGMIAGQSVPEDPDVPAFLASRIESLGLKDRLVITGFYEDVPALMRRLSVFCLTSDSEGTPNTILEAMAASIPVVATRVGGIPDLVQDNVSGLLVDRGDAEQLALAVRKLLDDPALADQMGRAGRAIIENHYSCEAIAARLENVYIQALQEAV